VASVPVRALGFVENAPGCRYQQEPADDETEAQEMERPEMGVGLPAEQHFQQVAGIVREPVDIRIPLLQPAREDVERKWKAVHLREQRNYERAERAE
jgi:hypothetical protein